MADYTVEVSIPSVGPATGTVAWQDILQKPSTFSPATHSHVIADVSNLQATLNAKAASTHSHVSGDISNFSAAVATVSPPLCVNVKDYGAQGNGSADDSAAVQNAIAAATASGLRKVFFPAGTYKCNIVLDGNDAGTALLGCGAGSVEDEVGPATVLSPQDDSLPIVWVKETAGVTIERLRLLGNGHATTTYGLRAYNPDMGNGFAGVGLFLRDVVIKNVQYGFWCGHAVLVRCESVYFQGFEFGFVTPSVQLSHSFVFDGCLWTNAGTAAAGIGRCVQMDDESFAVFENCEFGWTYDCCVIGGFGPQVNFLGGNWEGFRSPFVNVVKRGGINMVGGKILTVAPFAADPSQQHVVQLNGTNYQSITGCSIVGFQPRSKTTLLAAETFYTKADIRESRTYSDGTPVLQKTYFVTAATEGTCTISIASPAVVTKNAHGMVNGDLVTFRTNGALPTGLSTGPLYYVINAATNTFQVSLTSGGAAINTSGTQSGTHSAKPVGSFLGTAPVTKLLVRQRIVSALSLTGTGLTYSTVKFNATAGNQENVGGKYDASTGLFTPGKYGAFRISAAIFYNTAVEVSPGVGPSVYVAINGSRQFVLGYRDHTSTVPQTIGGDVIVRLAPSDTVAIQIPHDGNYTIPAGDNYHSYLFIEELDV